MRIINRIVLVVFITVFGLPISTGYASDPASLLSEAVVDFTHAIPDGSYRDPDGLLWGPVARNSNYQIDRMNFRNAYLYCDRRRERLPTIWDFERLKIHLGFSNGNYQPGLVPDLHGNIFWAYDGEYRSLFFASWYPYFNGSNGEIDIMRSGKLNAVRCVK